MNRKLGEERARPYWREYNTLLNFARKIGCEKIWDEDVIAFLRDQDQRQAELKAASMKNMQQAANIISFRKNKPSDENRFKSDILDLKSETKKLLAKRRAAAQ